MSTRAARGPAGLPPEARMRARSCTTVMALAEQPGARCQHRVPAAKAAVMARASKPAATRVADSLRRLASFLLALSARSRSRLLLCCLQAPMNAVVVPKAPEAVDVSSEKVPVPSPSSALTSTLMRFAAVSSSYFLTSSCAGLTKLFSRYSWAACRIRRSLLLLRARMSRHHGSRCRWRRSRGSQRCERSAVLHREPHANGRRRRSLAGYGRSARTPYGSRLH